MGIPHPPAGKRSSCTQQVPPKAGEGHGRDISQEPLATEPTSENVASSSAITDDDAGNHQTYCSLLRVFIDDILWSCLKTDRLYMTNFLRPFESPDSLYHPIVHGEVNVKAWLGSPVLFMQPQRQLEQPLPLAHLQEQPMLLWLKGSCQRRSSWLLRRVPASSRRSSRGAPMLAEAAQLSLPSSKAQCQA